MVNGLHVVAVEVAQEHTVVTRVILGPLPRGVQYLRPRRNCGLVDRINRGAVGRAEGQVHFTALRAGGRTEPEAGKAVRSGQTDDERIAA